MGLEARHVLLQLPVRRYAIFSDVIRGRYAIVVRGGDIAKAETWGGFVAWLGMVRPAETRDISRKRPNDLIRGASHETK